MSLGSTLPFSSTAKGDPGADFRLGALLPKTQPPKNPWACPFSSSTEGSCIPPPSLSLWLRETTHWLRARREAGPQGLGPVQGPDSWSEHFSPPCPIAPHSSVEGAPRFIPSGALRRAALGRSSQGQPPVWRKPKPSPYCGFWLHYVLVLLLC